MVDARQRDNWDHTSMLLALTANCNRDPKKRPLKPDDFNPFAVAKKTNQHVELAQMKAMFVRTKKKK
jgi:hypothetical protein